MNTTEGLFGTFSSDQAPGFDGGQLLRNSRRRIPWRPGAFEGFFKQSNNQRLGSRGTKCGEGGSVSLDVYWHLRTAAYKARD